MNMIEYLPIVLSGITTVAVVLIAIAIILFVIKKAKK
jgi:hypothetical protein